MSLLGIGARSLVPDELLEGFGYDADTDTYIIRPALPLAARVERNPNYPSPAHVSLFLGFSGWSDSVFRRQYNRLQVWQAAYDAVMFGLGRVDQTPTRNPNFLFRWRALGSSGGWTEIPGEFLGVSFNSVDSPYTSGNRFVTVVGIEDRRVDPTSADFDAGVAALPTEGQEIEFFLIGSMPPDEQHPVIIDGITAGEFTKNVYDGVYSERDEFGAIVPTGIRYNEAAVLLMTEPIRLVLTKPIDDARAWLEKHIYQPTGRVPALDELGRISPVSQEPPSSLVGLATLSDASAEARPDWSQGETIINVVRFTYPRYYAGEPPEVLIFTGVARQPVLEHITIEAIYKDPLSIERFGEQSVEIDGLAFGAIGLEAPDEETIAPTRPRVRGRRPNERPITDENVVQAGKPIVPISGDILDEVGYQLSLDRWEQLLNRYAFGAPTTQLAVFRSAIPNARAGSWVIVSFPWMPSDTGRRGLAGLAQIVALGDLDCAWREPTLELVVPVVSS